MIIILILILLIFVNEIPELTSDNLPDYEVAYSDSTPALFLVLTVDAEEKEDNLAIHGGILDAMLDIFEEEGLEGKVEILMPVDDWRKAVEDNLSIVERVNSYPISLHCDRHSKFIFQDREKQRERIFSSIAWIREHFRYSGRVFRAPTLMEGETTRDILNEAGISFDLTPQIYSGPEAKYFFPVLVRDNLSLLPTSLIITGGYPEYSMREAEEINKFYMKSFDNLYEAAKGEGPIVAIALLHPTNWNNETLKILRENLRYIKSKPGVKFITADEIKSNLPVLGKNPFSFSPRVGIVVEPREDYNLSKESFNDESFLLYALRSYGIRAEKAELAENYDTVIFYSPTGKKPEIDSRNIIVLNSGKLAGITPEALLNPMKSTSESPSELRCRLLKSIVNLKEFSHRALEDAVSHGKTPYLNKALKSRDECERINFAYLSREYALQIGILPDLKTKKQKLKKYSLVDSEIPEIYYGTVDGIHLGYQAAPHGIAQAAREAFYDYEKTGNRENLSRALFLVDYLLNTSVDKGDYLIWEYSFPWPPYNLERGWRGSLCQAGILKALMLAYKHTGEEKYRDAAEKTLKAFSVPVERGGLLELREGYYWYPEYVKEEPPYVLNGFVTTLIWLREYSEYFNSSEAERLYQEGLKTLIKFLPYYDAGNGHSYYDAMGNRANQHYHKMHIWQLGVMYNLTGEEIFKEYRELWLRSQ